MDQASNPRATNRVDYSLTSTWMGLTSVDAISITLLPLPISMFLKYANEIEGIFDEQNYTENQDALSKIAKTDT